jgi:hypothetical protein
MDTYKNGKRNGYQYTNKSALQNIEHNEFVKKIRKKLMEDKFKKKK